MFGIEERKMKRTAFLNTPAGILIAVSCVILVGEFLIMLLIEDFIVANLKDTFLEKIAFEFLDPILLIILVSPALHFLVFKPMRAQQVELAQQLFEHQQADMALRASEKR